MAELSQVQSRPPIRLRIGGLRVAASARAWLVAILFAGLAIRLLLTPYGSFVNDANFLRRWAVRFATEPLSEYYAIPEVVDHLPGDLWFLWALAKLYHLFSPQMDVQSPTFLFLLKLVPGIFDVGVGAMLYLVGRRLRDRTVGLFAAALFMVSPGPIFLSSIWGWWDSISAFFAVTALWLLIRGNPEWAFPALTYAVLTKPMFAALAPLFGLWFVRGYILPHVHRFRGTERRKLVELLSESIERGMLAVIGSLIVLLAVLLPFNVAVPPVRGRWSLWERLDYALNQYPYTTVNAFSLWGTPVGGNWRPQTDQFLLGLSFQTWGAVLLVSAYVFILVLYWLRGGDTVLVWAAAGINLALFVLPTQVHERYLFGAIPFTALLAAMVPRLIWFYIALSLSYFVNLYWAYDVYYDAPTFQGMYPSYLVFYGASLVNVLLLLYLFVRAFPLLHGALGGGSAVRRAPARGRRKSARAAVGGTSEVRGRHQATARTIEGVRRLMPLLLFAAALVLFLTRLDTPRGYIFDEFYHAETAGQYVAGNEGAYSFGPVSKVTGHQYEWTHPPLGKLLIADGIIAFGNNSFGWRFPSALFGAIGVVAVYLLGTRLAGSRVVGTLAGGLLLLDGLYFVQSRIGIVDVFITVFMMGALISFHRYLSASPHQVRLPLLATGGFIGLGIATKWNAAYASGLMGLVAGGRFLHLWWVSRHRVPSSNEATGVRQHLIWLPIAFAMLPLGIYLLAHVPFFLAGHSFGEFVTLQRYMWGYHTHLNATHPYQSQWWSWPFALQPVWYWNAVGGADFSVIYANGNPLLFGAFLPAMGWLCFRWWGRWPALGVMVLGFFGQWLPWAASPRMTFIYHFLPAVPFGCVAVAVAVVHMWRQGGRWQFVASAYVLLVVLSFMLFYPLHTGLPLSASEFDVRMWLDSWRSKH